jgi:hypothetical protein
VRKFKVNISHEYVEGACEMGGDIMMTGVE